MLWTVSRLLAVYGRVMRCCKLEGKQAQCWILDSKQTHSWILEGGQTHRWIYDGSGLISGYWRVKLSFITTILHEGQAEFLRNSVRGWGGHGCLTIIRPAGGVYDFQNFK